MMIYLSWAGAGFVRRGRSSSVAARRRFGRHRTAARTSGHIVQGKRQQLLGRQQQSKALLRHEGGDIAADVLVGLRRGKQGSRSEVRGFLPPQQSQDNFGKVFFLRAVARMVQSFRRNPLGTQRTIVSS